MGDDDYRFTYEHYRVLGCDVKSVPTKSRQPWMATDLGSRGDKRVLGGAGTQSAIDYCAILFNDAYRAELLLPMMHACNEDGDLVYDKDSNPIMVRPNPAYRPGYEPHTHGGKTICRVWWNENLLASATSWCSINDPFSYRVGRHISRGRALANLASLQEVAIG